MYHLECIPCQERYCLVDYREQGFEKANGLCFTRLLQQVLHKINGQATWPKSEVSITQQLIQDCES